MLQKVTFSAVPRQILGSKVKQLRQQSLIPASVSGNIDKPISISLKKNDFMKLYEKVGDTGLFYLTVEGDAKELPVLVTEVQHDPLSHQILNVSLRQVSLNQKVSAEVPVELVGEFEVKNALVVTLHDTIKVEAFPQDLPEKFVIDISGLKEFGDMITFEQLTGFDKTKVTLEVAEEELTTPIVIAKEIKEEVVEAAPTETATPAEGAAETPAESAPAAETTQA